MAPCPGVVVGLDSVTGLQTARTLASRGIRVIGVAGEAGHFASRTRACHRVVQADIRSDELIRALERLGPSLAGPAVLYPCTDLAVLLISRHRGRLEPWYRMVLPPAEVLDTLADKVRFYEYCQRAGLPIPRTRILRSMNDVEEAAATLRFPVIVKPPLRSARWEGAGLAKVHRVSRPPELGPVFANLIPWADALAAQEWIDGGDADLFSCHCYFDRSSRPLVTFVTRKLRQWPPGIGMSSLAEECRNDVVRNEALRLFEGLGFQGLGHVEIKREAGTGRYFILEANVGRTTGRSAMAERGGVELLSAMYCDALGLPLPSALEQRYGGDRWVYLRRDVPSALVAWRRGQLSLRDWAGSWRGIRHDAVFSLRDPAPFWADLLDAAGRLIAGRDRRRAGMG
jgi:D-aspartate ligase